MSILSFWIIKNEKIYHNVKNNKICRNNAISDIFCQYKKVPFWFAAFAIFMSQKDSCSPEVFLVGKKKVYSFIWFTVIIHIVQYLSQKYKLRVVLGLYWIQLNPILFWFWLKLISQREFRPDNFELNPQSILTRKKSKSVNSPKISTKIFS